MSGIVCVWGCVHLRPLTPSPNRDWSRPRATSVVIYMSGGRWALTVFVLRLPWLREVRPRGGDTGRLGWSESVLETAPSSPASRSASLPPRDGGGFAEGEDGAARMLCAMGQPALNSHILQLRSVLVCVVSVVTVRTDAEARFGVTSHSRWAALLLGPAVGKASWPLGSGGTSDPAARTILKLFKKPAVDTPRYIPQKEFFPPVTWLNLSIPLPPGHVKHALSRKWGEETLPTWG